MRFLITGSGGALRIPNATCACPVCAEARKKGAPYKRFGQSLYCRELRAVFDTPEDINEAVNAHGITSIDSVFFTHWHPDHTAGLRFIELLHCADPSKKIDVYLPPGGLDFSINGNSLLSWFESNGCCDIHEFGAPLARNGITVTPVLLDNGYVYAFSFDSEGKRVVHAPCHSMYLSDHPALRNPDILIAGMGIPHAAETDGSRKTSFDDNLRVMQMLKPRRMVLTHIEEEWRMNHDELIRFVSPWSEMSIAYDGMELSV